MSALNVTIINTLDDGFVKKWQDLWDDADNANFHNSPQWLQACIEGLHENDYSVLVVENGDRLDAVFPLVREKRFGISAWCSPGKIYQDKTSLLLRTDDKVLLRAIITKLIALGNLYLEELSEELVDVLTKIDKTLVRQVASTNPYLPLGSDPLRFMTGKARGKIQNRLKKNEEHITYACFKGDPKGLEIAFEIDARSTKTQHRMSSLATKQEKDFLYALLKTHGENFTVDILSYDNVPMVYGIGLTYKKTFHAFITAFDGKYSYFAPGKMIHFFMFKRLQEEGYELFDFSRGITVLKEEFTPLFKTQYDILYTKSALTMYWWKLGDWAYYFVLNNKMLYGTYLVFKNILQRT